MLKFKKLFKTIFFNCIPAHELQQIAPKCRLNALSAQIGHIVFWVSSIPPTLLQSNSCPEQDEVEIGELEDQEYIYKNEYK